MKQFLLLSLTLLFLASCTSVQKLADEGRYDEAIILSAKKISGKKNKKTKHVKAIEQAFAKVTARDMEEVQTLMTIDAGDQWDAIYEIYEAVDRRQDRISPFLPLVSKDGYQAKFKFVHTANLKEKAAKEAAKYHYSEAKKYLAQAESGDKQAARKVAYSLESIKKYFRSYEDAAEILKLANYLGKTRVSISMDQNADVFMPGAFERELMTVSVSDMNTRWTEFYLGEVEGLKIDIQAIMQIQDLAITPEKENVTHFIESKEIKDGFTYELDEDGNVKKDTLGNDIKSPKFRTVTAEIVEIHRFKSALVKGKILYIDAIDGSLIDESNINVEAVFDDFASTFRGDKRAIHDKTRSRLKTRPLPFPSDFDLTIQAASNLKEIMKREIRKSIL